MEHAKALVIRKRAGVQRLAAQGYAETEIAKRLLVSRPLIDRWVSDADVTTDRRGWPKGRLPSQTEAERMRIVRLRRALVAEKAFFVGPGALQQAYALRFQGAPSRRGGGSRRPCREPAWPSLTDAAAARAAREPGTTRRGVCAAWAR